MMEQNSKNLIDKDFSVKLMEHLVVPTFVLDVSGTVIIWNKACEALTGVKAEQLIGTKNHWQAFYDEPRECLADLLIKGDVDNLAELYVTHNDLDDNYLSLRAENWCAIPKVAGRFYLAIDAGPIYNNAGELIAVVETLRDFTEKKLAQEKLEHLAQNDGLTGLANRRVFDERLKSAWSLAQRTFSEISLLFIDIDHFKQFNDIYGHQEGDDCIKAVANIIAEQPSRPSDLSARYGGEEFIVILPGTQAGGAKEVAERIRLAILKLNWRHSANSAADCVTVSIGVASVTPNRQQSANSLVEMADKALYQAKSNNRNNSVLYKS